MWRGKSGPCTCFFCNEGKAHPTGRNGYHLMTSEGGHLQVAESLNPADIVRTKICDTCAHEVSVKFLDIQALFTSGDASEALYRAEEELIHEEFIQFAEWASYQ